MAFEDYEYSVSDAEPFELYDFTRGIWTDYLTTRATEFYISDSQIYRPAAISRGKIQQGEDVRKDTITITIPRGDNLAAQFISIAPETTTTITIRKMHREMNFVDAVVIWKGRVVGGEPKGEKMELSCESIYTSMRRQGLRLRCELICQHVLYDQHCKADQSSMRVDGEVDSMTSPTILDVSEASSYDDGWFSGGILDFEGDSRFIISHSDSTIRISRPLSELSVGDEVALYPGCDRTMTTCKDKFDNLNNFLGFPWFPQQNPFQVSIKT